jgi:hypothetical protein
MTYRNDFTLPTALLEQVSQQGFDILPELIRIVVNAAMQAERQQHLKIRKRNIYQWEFIFNHILFYEINNHLNL